MHKTTFRSRYSITYLQNSWISIIKSPTEFEVGEIILEAFEGDYILYIFNNFFKCFTN